MNPWGWQKVFQYKGKKVIFNFDMCIQYCGQKRQVFKLISWSGGVLAPLRIGNNKKQDPKNDFC